MQRDLRECIKLEPTNGTARKTLAELQQREKREHEAAKGTYGGFFQKVRREKLEKEYGLECLD